MQEEIKYDQHVYFTKKPALTQGDVLHTTGLGRWHVEILRVKGDLPALSDGRVGVIMDVKRTCVGSTREAIAMCPVCDEEWPGEERDL